MYISFCFFREVLIGDNYNYYADEMEEELCGPARLFISEFVGHYPDTQEADAGQAFTSVSDTFST
jgi:hypothetical protein